MKRYLILICSILILSGLSAATILGWDFENNDLEPHTGSGGISLIGGMTDDGFGKGYPDDPSRGWSTTTFPAQGTANLTAGMMIEFSTAGYANIEISWVLRHSNKAPNRSVMYYTLDHTASPVQWTEAVVNTVTAGDTWYPGTFDGSTIEGFNNNPHLAIKIVAAFGDDANSVYVPSKPTGSYASDGKWRWDDILITGDPLLPHLEVVAELDDFYAAPGALSELQEYQLIGQNLLGNIQITVSHPFRIRASDSEDFTTSLELLPRSGGIDKTIQILFQPTQAGDFSEDIIHETQGVESLALPVFGFTTKPQPSAYPTAFGATQTSYYQTLLNWTDSTGPVLPDGYLIRGSKVDAASIEDPVDGVEYPDKKLTKNVPFGVQNQLVFDLNEDHTYYFKIFPYTNTGAAIDYKIDGSVPLISVSTTIGPIGSTLNVGDLAFVEYASDSPDRFTFVLLTDVLENTKINFTDKAWDGTAFAPNEETCEWRGVGRPYLAGEVIHIVEEIDYPDEGSYHPGFSGFSNDGDQIIAYQGYLTQPSFIAAFSTCDWLTEGIPTNNSSYLPEPLVLGETALGFDTEIDNGVYHGITTGTATQLRLAMNNPANWTRANSLNNIDYPIWQINVISGLPQPELAIELTDTGMIMLSWEAVPGAYSYTLYYSEDPYAQIWQTIEGIPFNYIELLPSEATDKMFYKVKAVH